MSNTYEVLRTGPDAQRECAVSHHCSHPLIPPASFDCWPLCVWFSPKQWIYASPGTAIRVTCRFLPPSPLCVPLLLGGTPGQSSASLLYPSTREAPVTFRRALGGHRTSVLLFGNSPPSSWLFAVLQAQCDLEDGERIISGRVM